MFLQGTVEWNIPRWITLDNIAVVHEAQAIIEGGIKKKSDDDQDIWDITEPLIKDAAQKHLIKITWAKAHAKERMRISGASGRR